MAINFSPSHDLIQRYLQGSIQGPTISPGMGMNTGGPMPIIQGPQIPPQQPIIHNPMIGQPIQRPQIPMQGQQNPMNGMMQNYAKMNMMNGPRQS